MALAIVLKKHEPPADLPVISWAGVSTSPQLRADRRALAGAQGDRPAENTPR